MTRQKEGLLDDRIIRYCKEKKVFAFKCSEGGGLPDLHLCPGGRAIYFETKIGYNKMSKLQLAQQKRIEESGALFFEIRDFNTAKEIIDTYSTLSIRWVTCENNN